MALPWWTTITYHTVPSKMKNEWIVMSRSKILLVVCAAAWIMTIRRRRRKIFSLTNNLVGLNNRSIIVVNHAGSRLRLNNEEWGGHAFIHSSWRNNHHHRSVSRPRRKCEWEVDRTSGAAAPRLFCFASRKQSLGVRVMDYYLPPTYCNTTRAGSSRACELMWSY